METPIVTPSDKDKVLNYLAINFLLERFYQVDTTPAINELDISFEVFYPILNQFQRMGLIKDLGINKRSFSMIVLTETHDFALRGGFVAQEELLEKNIEKLLFEIDNLKKELAPNHLETVNKLSSIATAVISGLGLIKKNT